MARVGAGQAAGHTGSDSWSALRDGEERAATFVTGLAEAAPTGRLTRAAQPEQMHLDIDDVVVRTLKGRACHLDHLARLTP